MAIPSGIVLTLKPTCAFDWITVVETRFNENFQEIEESVVGRRIRLGGVVGYEVIGFPELRATLVCNV